MKRLFIILAAALLGFQAFLSCNPAEPVETDPFIEIDRISISAPYQGVITSINMDVNTKWTLSRTNEAGEEIDWVKFDRISGDKPVELGVKVIKNPGKEIRKALVVFTAGTAKAILTVTQEGNPEEPVTPPVPPTPIAEGYDFPMVQKFTTGMGIDCESSGKVVRVPFDEMPLLEARWDGSKVTFDKGLEIEASSGYFTVGHPCHTQPSKNAGFMEGLVLEGFESGTITYTIPFKNEVCGKVRFAKGQRREKAGTDSYEWSTDGGTTWTTVGSAKAGTSDACWKYLDFEIPQDKKVAAGGSLKIRLTVTYNPDNTYGGVILQTGVALMPGEAQKSDITVEDPSTVVFCDGFDATPDTEGVFVEMDCGFLKSWTSGKYNSASYTADMSTAPAMVTPDFCYARPGYMQIGFGDEAFAFNASHRYVHGSYKINVGSKLAEMGIEKTNLTVLFKAAGLTTAFEEPCNANPVLSASTGTVSGNGAVALVMDTWKQYRFTVNDADQSTVLELASVGTSASPLTGLTDDRFFVDDILIVTGTLPDPEPQESLEICFDFTGEPQDGWITEQKNAFYPDGGQEFGYTTGDGTTYMILLATCNTGKEKTQGPCWFPPKDDAPGYLSMYAQYRYFGMPVIDGFSLAKVVIVGGGVSLSAIKPKLCITDSIAKSTDEAKAITNESECVVSGGGYQELEASGEGTLTYELSGTQPDKQYYLYGLVKGTIASITVTYNKF